MSFNPFWKFLRHGNSAWDLLRVKFWSRDYFGFCWKSLGFFWVLIFAPIRSPTPHPPRGSNISYFMSFQNQPNLHFEGMMQLRILPFLFFNFCYNYNYYLLIFICQKILENTPENQQVRHQCLVLLPQLQRKYPHP